MHGCWVCNFMMFMALICFLSIKCVTSTFKYHALEFNYQCFTLMYGFSGIGISYYCSSQPCCRSQLQQFTWNHYIVPLAVLSILLTNLWLEWRTMITCSPRYTMFYIDDFITILSLPLQIASVLRMYEMCA